MEDFIFEAVELTEPEKVIVRMCVEKFVETGGKNPVRFEGDEYTKLMEVVAEAYQFKADEDVNAEDDEGDDGWLIPIQGLIGKNFWLPQKTRNVNTRIFDGVERDKEERYAEFEFSRKVTQILKSKLN